MELIFVSLLATVTSLAGYSIVKRRRQVTAESLFNAVGKLLDWAGLFTLFMFANLALGVLIVLLVRGLSSHFVSMYQVESIFILILSGAQAFVFCLFHERV